MRAPARRTDHIFVRVANGLGAVNETIGVFARNAAGALLAVMTLIVMIGVVSRYGFNASIPWSEEISKTLMVWTAFLVAPWGYRHGAHVSIDLFADAMGHRARAAVESLLTIAVLWVAIVFLGESLALIERGMKGRLATVPVPTGVVYTIIPVSLAMLIGVGVETLLRGLYALQTGESAEVVPPVHRREA